MRKLAIGILSVALTFSFVGVANAAPHRGPVVVPGYTTVTGTFTNPSCVGTYDHLTTITKAGVVLNLNSGNNLVVLTNASGRDIVTTGSGNDCYVINSDGNIITAGSGKDTVNTNSYRNQVDAGSGNDTIHSNLVGARDIIDGGAGTDTCTYDVFTTIAKNCEL